MALACCRVDCAAREQRKGGWNLNAKIKRYDRISNLAQILHDVIGNGRLALESLDLCLHDGDESEEWWQKAYEKRREMAKEVAANVLKLWELSLEARDLDEEIH